MNQGQTITSVSDMIRQMVSPIFEKIMLDEIAKIEAKVFTDLSNKFAEVKAEAKTTAFKLAVDLLRQHGMSGVTVEVKL